MRFRLSECVVDLAVREIRSDEDVIHVEPQVFDVLVYLIEHRERAVAKTELLDEIWGDQFVSESALTSRVKSARSAIGDDGTAQSMIRTVRGFGYQFVGPVAVDEASATTVVRTSRPANAGLPTYHSPLRGREADSARVRDLAASSKLVTLVGPGGVGKTRLAVESAAEERRRVAFVDLTRVDEPSGVPLAVAAALGVESGDHDDPTASVTDYLAAVAHLVLLDNCEHVLPAAGAVAGAIADACPATTVVATSREALSHPAEVVVRIEPLPVLSDSDILTPDRVAANPAAALFLDRGGPVMPGLELDARQARIIVELCAALDGLPLALELAAGRLATYGLDDLVELLEQRLDVLGDRGASRADRHRTLRATVEWSYDGLDEDSRRLFRALAVFPAGVDLRAARTLAARLDVGPEAVGRLVDCSLVTRADGPAGSRYGMLETLRAYGLDRVDETGEMAHLREHLAAGSLAFVEEAAKRLHSPDEETWIERIEHELPNIRAARAFLASEGRDADLLAISKWLSEWARTREVPELIEWAADLRTRSDDLTDGQRATLLAVSTQFAWRAGDYGAAIELGTEALTITGDDWTRARTLAELGTAYLFSGELSSAVECWLEEVEVDDSTGSWGAAAIATAYGGDIDGALELAAEAARAAEATGSRSGAAWAAYARAEVDRTRGVTDPAVLESAIEHARSVRASFVEGVAMVTLASTYAAAGSADLAASTYSELIEHWLRLGSLAQLWTTLRNVAELLERSAPTDAWHLLAAADAAGHAPALDEATAERLVSLRERLASGLGTDALVAAPDDAPTASERALAALADLAAL